MPENPIYKFQGRWCVQCPKCKKQYYGTFPSRKVGKTNLHYHQKEGCNQKKLINHWRSPEDQVKRSGILVSIKEKIQQRNL